MTPLIVILNELGQEMSAAVLRERVVDTVLGCVISLTLGTAVGSLFTSGGRSRLIASKTAGPDVAPDSARDPGTSNGHHGTEAH